MIWKIRQWLKKFQILRLIKESRDLHSLERQFFSNIDSSFANEKWAVDEVLRKLDIRCGRIVDIGAGDGFTQSSTRHLFKSGWEGLVIEYDPQKFSKLAFLYRSFPKVYPLRIKVTPDNIVSILQSLYGNSEFEFLNLDIDSYDLSILKSLIQNEIYPKVISMEINEKIPPGIIFDVHFDELHTWQNDDFFGCSLDAAFQFLGSQGYVLANMEYNNAIFVSQKISQNRVEGLQPYEAYKKGYWERSNRQSLFHWNSRVDYWNSISVEAASLEIKKWFAKYEGRFTLKIVEELR